MIDTLLVFVAWIGLSWMLAVFLGRMISGGEPKDPTWADFTRAEQSWCPPTDVVDHSFTVHRGPYDCAGDF